jgi:aquaglyceroporin related protein, other eukaryote
MEVMEALQSGNCINSLFMLIDRWGIGVMFGVYVAGISGAHLNPAVTLANCVFRGFPWRKFLGYTIAQTLGAFFAAAVIYGNYRSSIDQFEGIGIRTVGGPNSTAGIFSTYPAPHLSTAAQFFGSVSY